MTMASVRPRDRVGIETRIASLEADVAAPASLTEAPPAWAVELLAEVRALRLAVDHIEAAIARLAPEPRISRHDRAALARLLPMLDARFGTAPFTTGDVMAVPALCAAGPRLSLKAPTKALGKFFSRVHGISINGRRLAAAGSDAGARLWCVSTLGLSGLTEPFKAA